MGWRLRPCNNLQQQQQQQQQIRPLHQQLIDRFLGIQDTTRPGVPLVPRALPQRHDKRGTATRTCNTFAHASVPLFTKHKTTRSPQFSRNTIACPDFIHMALQPFGRLSARVLRACDRAWTAVYGPSTRADVLSQSCIGLGRAGDPPNDATCSSTRQIR